MASVVPAQPAIVAAAAVDVTLPLMVPRKPADSVMTLRPSPPPADRRIEGRLRREIGGRDQLDLATPLDLDLVLAGFHAAVKLAVIWVGKPG